MSELHKKAVDNDEDGMVFLLYMGFERCFLLLPLWLIVEHF